jgi:hypothetical protein
VTTTAGKDVLLTTSEAAEPADVKPSQLKVWLKTDKFKPSAHITPANAPGETTYYFTEADVKRLMEFAGTEKKRKPTKDDGFTEDGKQETFTVSEIASMWKFSTDTVQRMFEDEQGVVVLGNPNPRGKRRRITLRIPRAVMERVKKRRSNS